VNPVSPVIPNRWAARNMPSPFPEVVYAKDQPEYNPLPSIKQSDGCVVTRWAMSWRERLRVLLTGSIYLEVLTFNQPLQPLKMSVTKPEAFQ
jgi:hypothetical protein